MVAKGQVKNGVIVLEEGVCLPEGQVVDVLLPVTQNVAAPAPSVPHSLLDIPAVHVGAILRPFTSDDDLLGEMLEDRP